MLTQELAPHLHFFESFAVQCVTLYVYRKKSDFDLKTFC